ncbi:heme biosynthesis HemY N-terminal domain-containing protein [Jeongeupia chitinilytica]|uniref:Porphyrin biosynthesis-like protein n=1 Tax=Jeongeupia chitinilytica TaxID=1041641 RepID=A0ABQ3H480_9NEIS|nr:heme biosynthesis HemY N-terminal domain-containing protein [Jeongeupia chitinilytica]GHD64255.1 porphyrin biosynthesis-like protein [Jeongeupia chitinilytica]
MRALLWLIALFALAVGLTLFAQLNTGYALLFVPPWRIEISLNVFIVGILVLVAALYLLARVIAELGGLPDRVKAYRLRKARDASVQLERDARIAFFEGRYQRAERLAGEALAASRETDAFAVNGILAARAAHLMRDFAKRDQYFARLRERLGPRHLALAMTMAELYLDERRNQDAETALAEARSLSPKLTAMLKLELRLRQREDNAEAIVRLVEQLTKSDALDAGQAQAIRLQAYQNVLQRQPKTPRELRDWWNKLPVADRAAPALVATLADAYAAQGEPAAARDAIEAALAQNWSSELAERYGTLGLDGDALVSQLQQAESWLKTHPNDPQLLLTLGRLCTARALWGKAQTYFEASIAVAPTALAHTELAALLERLERPEEANRHYRASLALAVPVR